MKKHLLLLSMLAFGLQAQAQQEMYALTGMQSPNIVFKDFRALDMKNGQTSSVLFSSDSTPNVISDTRKNPVTEDKNSYNNSQAQAIATLALDAKGNNLVYMPMYSTNIYALDLRTKNITLIENAVAKNIPCDINSHFSRMVTGTDGNIYALNNVGSQLLKISNENGKWSVSDLGEVTNDKSNGENKLQIMTIGFGGDMVADANNNFYIFSASGNVFKFNLQDKNAKFIGKVTGLPENYSLNGAAVNEQGNIVVGSAKGGEMYALGMDNLVAKPIFTGVQHQIYDLASKYFIGEGKTDIAIVKNDILPTKVTESFINIQLESSLTRASLTAEVFDAFGTKVLDKKLNLDRKLNLPSMMQGTYLVIIKDEKGEILISKRILFVS